MPLPPNIFPEPISLKQVIFMMMTLGYFIVAIPLAKKYVWMERACIAGILFMVINPIDVTFFSYTAYRGDIRGIEFGVTDWFTITLIVTMRTAPRWRKRQLYYKNPSGIIMGLYLTWCILSIFTAMLPQFAFFGVTRLIRGYMLFWVAFNWIADEDDLRFIIWSVVGITMYSFVQVLMDKYMRGVFPPRGSFDHQNTLASFQNFMNFIIFSILLGDSNKNFDKRTLIYWVALGAGVLTSVATLSRGGMATMVMGFLIIIPIALWLKQTGKKRKKKQSALGIMALGTLPLLALILPEVIKRFETAPEASGHARDVFNILAKELGDSSFFGIGLNNYSFAGCCITQYRDQLPNVDQGGLAHHIYWLHYAELGSVGVTLFILMMLSFILVIIRFIWKRKDGLERVFAIGILAGLCVAMLIGTLEWNWRQTQMTITYLMFAGFAESLPRLERERIRSEKRRKRALARMHMLAQQQRGA